MNSKLAFHFCAKVNSSLNDEIEAAAEVSASPTEMPLITRLDVQVG